MLVMLLLGHRRAPRHEALVPAVVGSVAGSKNPWITACCRIRRIQTRRMGAASRCRSHQTE